MNNQATDARRHDWFPVDNVVIEKYELNPYEGWLYVVIIKYANRKTGEAFPSIATLAQVANMSKQSVLRSIKALESKGLIRVDRKQKEHSKENDVNHYHVLDVAEHETKPNATAPSVGSDSQVPRGNTEAPGVVPDVDWNNTQLNKINTIAAAPTAESGSASMVEVDSHDADVVTTETPSLFRTIQAGLVALSFGGNKAQYGNAGDLAHVILGDSDKKQYVAWNVEPGIMELEWSAIKLWYADKRDKQGEPLKWPRSAQGLNQMVYEFRKDSRRAQYMRMALERHAPPVDAQPTDFERAMEAANHVADLAAAS